MRQYIGVAVHTLKPGMIEQPVWLWYGDWNEQINIIT